MGDILWVIQDKTDALVVEAERRAHAAAMEEANARLTMSLQLAEIRAKEIVLLTELSGVLQSCQTRDEIFAAVQTYAGFLFTDEAGAIYYLNETRNALRRGASWGKLQADADTFPIDDCWALAWNDISDLESKPESITLSMGLAVMPLHVTRGEDLLAAADAALYEAKRAGRNRIVVSDRNAATAVSADTAA